MSEPTDALEHDWARLHPLSPVVQFGRALVVVVIVFVPRLLSGASLIGTVIDVGALVLGLLGGFVHWMVTRWRVAGSELQIETGLLRRQSIRVPLSRVQTVDLVRPALGRVFGLSEVRVETAGQGAGRGRLAYLPDQRAQAVRAQLLALAHGLPDSTPTPAGVPVWSIDNGRLVASALLGAPTTVVAALAGVLVVVAATAPAALPGALGSLVPMLILSVTVIGRRVVAEFGMTVESAGDGLRLHAGLLQTRTQTIPAGRVQAIRCSQPLLWRLLGWYRLEVDIARQRAGRRGAEGDSTRVSRALLPVGRRADADRLLALVLPGVAWRPPPGARPPRRARVKAPLTFPALAAWCDEHYLATRTGRLRLVTMLVPLAKVQSVRFVSGPIQRRLRIANVHADLAGRGWRAAAKSRDADDALHLWTELGHRARQARTTHVAGSGPSRTGQ